MIPPPSGPSVSDESTRRSPKAQSNHVKSLIKSHPELVPLHEHLPSLDNTSRALTYATGKHDPTISDQLALGEAADIDNQPSGARRIPIVALVLGVSGESIRFVRIREERTGWSRKGVSLRIPCIQGSEESTWMGFGAPVKQIRFAGNTEGTAMWMAARLPGSTVFFRPVYRRFPRSTFNQRDFASRNRAVVSRLDPNPVFTLPILSTGGIEHADIAFNPWYRRQFAVVDQSGSWSVYDFEGQKRGRSTWHAKQVATGHLQSEMLEEDRASMPTNVDGWHAICWIGSLTTLLVCNRKQLAVFQFGESAQRMPGPNLGLRRGYDWILDVRRHSEETSHVFVLTSSNILLLRLEEDGRSSVIATWSHFRDDTDISMRLELVLQDNSMV